MQDLMAVSIPLETELSYISQEAGPVTTDDLSHIIREASIIPSETMAFNMYFKTIERTIPRSSADIIVKPNKTRLGLEKIVILPPLNEPQLFQVLNGGRLEELRVNYPGFFSSTDDFAEGAEALGILRDNLDFLQKAGYELSISPFRIGHYIVQVPSSFSGFSRDYGAKVNLRTKEMIKGKPERKLVLSFTQDMESSREVRVYREILNLLNRSLE